MHVRNSADKSPTAEGGKLSQPKLVCAENDLDALRASAAVIAGNSTSLAVNSR